MVVKFEPLIKREIMQCKRCQRYGHASPNCKMAYRCVKCSSPHLPGEWKLDKNNIINTRLYCTLCNKNGHQASYKGCEIYKNLISKMNNKKETLENIHEKKYQINFSFINKNKKFSDLFNDSNSLNTINKNSNDKKIEDLGELKNNILQILNKMTSIEKNINLNASRIDNLYNIFNNA